MEDKLLGILNTLLEEIGMDRLETLDPNADLKDDIGLDSISYADLIVQIDDAFKIEVNSKGPMNTVKDILDFLNT